MSKTKIIFLILFGFFTCHLISNGQTNMDNDIYSIQEDILPNWSIEQTYISIDTNCILKSTIEVDGKRFNYKREYKLTKGYYEWGGVNTGQIIEYGNLDRKKRANGIWIYKLRDDWTPINGKVENGNKIGWWGYNCSFVCKMKYSWNWLFTKTKLTKRRIHCD